MADPMPLVPMIAVVMMETSAPTGSSLRLARWPLIGEPISPRVRRLSHFDQMTIGIASITTDFVLVLLRRRQEFRTPRAPFGVHSVHVRHSYIEETANPVGVGGRLKGDLRLVVGRPSADVDDDPTVRQLDIREPSGSGERIATTEHIGVEAARALDIVRHDEVGQYDSLWGPWELVGGRTQWPVIGHPVPLRVRGLPHFDQMTIGITDVATDLVLVLFRGRQELSTPRAPFGVHRLHVLDPDVDEAAHPIRVAGRLQGDLRLVVGRTSAGIDDDPTIGKCDVGRPSGAGEGDPAPEDFGVEAPRPLDVARHDEVCEQNLRMGRWDLGHLLPPIVFHGQSRAICACMGCKGGGILAISIRRVLNAESKMVEKLGNGWMTSLNTSNGTRARMASVACWSHSPASAPRA